MRGMAMNIRYWLFALYCCKEAEDSTLVKAQCQILGIILENLKKLGDGQNQAERVLLESFRD